MQLLRLAGHKNASYALLAQPSLVTLHFVLESAGGYTNPEFDKVYLAAASTVDAAKRAALAA